MKFIVLLGLLINIIIAFYISKHSFNIKNIKNSLIIFLGHWIIFLVLPIAQTLGIITAPLILKHPFAIQIFGIIIFLTGLLITVFGRVSLRDNYANGTTPEIITDQKLVTNGIYSYTRNPIYLGKLLFFVGFELSLNSWLLILIVPIAIAFHRAILKEEKLLTQAFSQEFSVYKSKTRRYL